MTLPDERTRSIQYARQLLRDLLIPKKTPRVPRYVRQRAYSALRHFPWDLHIAEAAKYSPDVFDTPKKDDDSE